MKVLSEAFDTTHATGIPSSPVMTLSRLPWGIIGTVGLLVAAFGYVYAPVLRHLALEWQNGPDYSHGFFIPLVSAYFLWQRYDQLAQTGPQSNWWGVGVLLLGLCQLGLGHVGAELFLMRTSMVVVIAGLVLYLLGSHILRLTAFPIAFLLLAIPLPAILLNIITLPLQLLAAKSATAALRFVMLPVYREGNVIFLPHTTLEIVEACSGIRSLITLVALSVVVAVLSQPTIVRRLVMVLSSIPIVLVANACRIWGTGVLAYYFGSEVADGFYHSFAGWAVFGVAFLCLGIESVLLARVCRPRQGS
jgi:exosortase